MGYRLEMSEIKFYFICFVVLIVIALPCHLFFEYGNKQTTTCTVKEKWIKRYNNSDVYLVRCGNEVYAITDLFFIGKFNSSDLYSNLKVGHKYKITTTSFRIPLLSSYKNINKLKEVK